MDPPRRTGHDTALDQAERNPKPPELEARDRILGWAARYVTDPEWFIQKAVAWWLRDLSKRDPDRTRAFLANHGDAMKPFARKEAARLLTDLHFAENTNAETPKAEPQ